MTDTGDLSGRTSRGAAVTLFGNLLVKGLAVVALVVVARVLDANTYGPVILALAVFGFAEVLTSPVLQTTLLREPKLTDELIDVAWTISVVRGVLLTIAMYGLAPLIATVWPDNQIVMVGYLRVLSFSFAAGGLLNLHLVRLRRELRFARAFLIESTAPFCATTLAIAMLLVTGEPVFLLVCQVVGLAIGSLVSLLAVRPRPRFRLRRLDAQRLWRFSRPLMLSTAMIFVLLNGDDLFVQATAGTAALGVYAMSYRWSNLGANLAVQGLQTVLTAAYVKMRGDAARLQHAVVSTLSVITAMCALLSALFLAFATEFFACLGGDKWQGADAVARALVPLILCRAVNGSLGPVFLIHGKPHWLTAVTACAVLLFVPMMFLGFELFAVPGIAAAISLLAVMASISQTILVDRLAGIRPTAVLGAVLPPLGIALVAAFVGHAAVAPAASMEVRLFGGSAITVATFLLLWEFSCRAFTPLPQRSFFHLAAMLTR